MGWLRARSGMPNNPKPKGGRRTTAEGKRGRKPRVGRNLDTGEVFPSAAEEAD